MDYKKHYLNLVERAHSRQLNCYTERHHIIPRCLGGSDNENNLVDLTPEEHYVAHQLLVKMYPDEPKLVYAAHMMIPNRPNNKMYGWLKRKYSKAVSENQSGSGNSQYGRSRSDETKRKISETFRKKRIPDLLEDLSICLTCKRSNEARYWYDRLNTSNASSIGEFVKESNYDKSKVAFIKMLKKYVPEFSTMPGKRYVPTDRASERA